MEIEEVAAKTPEKIHKVAVDPSLGLTDADADRCRAPDRRARRLGRSRRAVILQGAVPRVRRDRRFADRNQSAGRDRRRQGDRLDAKISSTDNALFRHPDIARMRDLDEEDPAEIEASKFDLAYISWTATSAAWSTARASRWRRWTSSSYYGAEPANFLDVGGGANSQKVAAAFSHPARDESRSRRCWSTSSAASCVRRDRRRASSTPRARSSSTSRWWSGWKAPTSA